VAVGVVDHCAGGRWMVRLGEKRTSGESEKKRKEMSGSKGECGVGGAGPCGCGMNPVGLRSEA
jgi:hypothetical protein